MIMRLLFAFMITVMLDSTSVFINVVFAFETNLHPSWTFLQFFLHFTLFCFKIFSWVWCAGLFS